MMHPSPDEEQRARAWWATVSENPQAVEPSASEQLTLVPWTRFLPHIVGFIQQPIPALQAAALYALEEQRRNLPSNYSTSLAIAQLAKTPERFDAEVLEALKPGLSRMVDVCRDSENFAEMLEDYLDDAPFDPAELTEFDGEPHHG